MDNRVCFYGLSQIEVATSWNAGAKCIIAESLYCLRLHNRVCLHTR